MDKFWEDMSAIATSFHKIFIENMIYDSRENPECCFIERGIDKIYFHIFFRGKEEIFLVPESSCIDEYPPNFRAAIGLFLLAVRFDLEKFVEDAIAQQVENPVSRFSIEKVCKDASDLLARIVGAGFAIALSSGDNFTVGRFGLNSLDDGMAISFKLPYNLDYRVVVPNEDGKRSALNLGKVLIRDEKRFDVLNVLKEQNKDKNVSMAHFLIARRFVRDYLWAILSALDVKAGR